MPRLLARIDVGTTGVRWWFRDTVGTLEMEREVQQGENAFNALNDLAAQAPPGSRGVLFLPYLSSGVPPIGIPMPVPHSLACPWRMVGLS